MTEEEIIEELYKINPPKESICPPLSPDNLKRKYHFELQTFNRIANSKSLNRVWLADALGFDVDYNINDYR